MTTTKSVMSKPLGRGRNILDDLEQAQETIESAPSRLQPEPAPSDQPELSAAPASDLTHYEPPSRSRAAALKSIESTKARKEPTVQANARYPVSLLDDVENIAFLIGISKTDIMVEGTRREVARLRKAHGLE